MSKRNLLALVCSATFIVLFFFPVYSRASAPVPALPSDGQISSDDTPTFTWSYSNTHDFFHIQISVDSSFQSSSIVREQEGITLRSYTPLPMVPNTYHWRVKARDAGGVWSGWSVLQIFTVEAPKPAPPTMTHPIDGAYFEDLTPDLVWQHEGASYFHVQVSRNSSFNDIVSENNHQNSMNYTPTNLVEYGVYWWRVKAYYGAWSEWSSPARSIEIASATISHPSLVSPLHGSSLTGYVSDVVFKWDRVLNAFGYEMMIDGSLVTIASGGVAEKQYSLGYFGSHSWKIRTKNRGGSYGDWSPQATFSLLQESTQTTNPVNEEVLSGNNLMLDWVDVPNATGYDVLLDNDPGFLSPEIKEPGIHHVHVLTSTW